MMIPGVVFLYFKAFIAIVSTSLKLTKLISDVSIDISLNSPLAVVKVGCHKNKVNRGRGQANRQQIARG
jgi:hypothetical protein